MTINHLAMIGCGHMGYAMLRPWVERRAAARFTVITPRLESLHGLEKQGVQHIAYPADMDDVPDIMVLAVKPQILGAVLSDYKKFCGTLFLSVVASKPLEFYEKTLGPARVVRAMPNLPAKIGQGATLLVANNNVHAADKTQIEKLVTALGLAVWLDHEGQMDAATALSGCGPAYFYLMADILARAGAELGLAPALAQQLAKQTLIGSAGLWQADNTAAQTLYESIAVKGGLTEAALGVLQQEDALKTLMRGALLAAMERAKKLAL